MLQWMHPWALLLLLLPAYLLWAGRRVRRPLLFPRTAALAQWSTPLARVLGGMPEVLRALTLTLLILALARPRTGAAMVEERSEGVPMMIALDISSSMLAEDFLPRNRLQVAKEMTSEFISSRATDPIGLVAFAGEAITQVPVTTDYRVLFSALDLLQVGLLEDGTAIGMGLATAANRLQRVPGESRVVILLSDGENNRGQIEPLTAARAAAAQGIRVYTIGVGSDDPAPVPLRRIAGEEPQFAELPVGLDEELLRQIAELTGANYFRADNPAALRQVYQEIDRLVRTPVEIRRFVEYREWYPLLVLLGTVALLLEWYLRGSRWGRVP